MNNNEWEVGYKKYREEFKWLSQPRESEIRHQEQLLWSIIDDDIYEIPKEQIFEIINNEDWVVVVVEKYRWEFEKILSQIIEEKEKWRKYVEAQDEAYFQAVENWCPNPWINSLIF